MRPRSLFLCLTWALGLSLFCLLSFLGIGWSLSTQQGWLESLVGRERFDRWYQTYAMTAATLLPGDRDGDGVSDGLELFIGTDPDNASSFPSMNLVPGYGGFQVFPQTYPKQFWNDRFIGYMVPNGERREVQERIVVDAAPGVPFPRGFRLRLTPSPGVSLAAAGGSFATGPLVVPVTTNGFFEFEIQASPQSGNGKAFVGNISMANAATGKFLQSMPVSVIRTEDSVVATVEEIHKDNPLYAQFGVSDPEKTRVLRVQWTTIPPSPKWGLIEAARDTPDAKWYPVSLCSPSRTSSCLVAQQRVADRFNDYIGPLKFRIVPFQLPPP